ncbi:MAG: class I SAM-dependent methyltransferase, partial [Xanthobacteraceae bacterium]
MTARKTLSFVLATASIVLVAITLASAQHDGKFHERFDDPAKWSKSFDDPARDKWQMPGRVIAALALPSNAVVADIGAGTGYLAARLARHLKDGIVYAVDIEKAMVDHLAERAKASGLGNLRAVLGTTTAANLPEPVDLVVLLNVYHHVEKRPAYFKRLRTSLKPGGRVAIIDYRPEAPRGAPKHMRLAVEKIDEEMQLAGYA